MLIESSRWLGVQDLSNTSHLTLNEIFIFCIYLSWTFVTSPSKWLRSYILYLVYVNICHIPISKLYLFFCSYCTCICQSSLKIIQVLYDVLMSCHIMMSYHLPAKRPKSNLFQFKEFWKRQSLRRKNCSALEPIDSMENSHSGEIFLLICGK